MINIFAIAFAAFAAFAAGFCLTQELWALCIINLIFAFANICIVVANSK